MNLIIANDYGHINGGAAKVALQSAEALAARGHEVTFLAAVGPYPAKLPTLTTGQPDLLTDPSRMRAAARGLWNLQAGDMLAAHLRTQDRSRTLIHVHGWVKALSPSIIATAVNLGFPVVVTLHDYFAACPNGGFFNYQTAAPCLKKPLSADCLTTACDARKSAHKLWRVGRQIVQRRFGRLEQVRDFIFVSHFSRRILEPYLPARAAFHHVDNPIGMAKAAPVNCGRNDAFVFLGRLSPEKGPHIFAQAAQKAGCRAVLIGEGELDAQLTRDYPALERVAWQDAAGVNQWLGRARALVFPSIWYETLGLVVLEAMARGVPVICSDQTAAAELVSHGRHGFRFRSGDAADLAHKIELLNDPARAAELGAHAYHDYWAAPRSLENHVSDLERVYAQVIANKQTTVQAHAA